MDHETALNMILAHDCPNNQSASDPDTKEFLIELCCVTVKIVARLIEVEPEIRYEIKSVEITR